MVYFPLIKLCDQANKKGFLFVAYHKYSYEDLIILFTLNVAGPCGENL